MALSAAPLLLLLAALAGRAEAEEVVHVLVEGPIDVGTQSLIRRALVEAEAADDPLVIELNTPGGGIEEMWQIGGMIDRAVSRGVSVVTWVNREALSAGMAIALAGDRDLRPRQGGDGRGHAGAGAARGRSPGRRREDPLGLPREVPLVGRGARAARRAGRGDGRRRRRGAPRADRRARPLPERARVPGRTRRWSRDGGRAAHQHRRRAPDAHHGPGAQLRHGQRARADPRGGRGQARAARRSRAHDRADELRGGSRPGSTPGPSC